MAYALVDDRSDAQRQTHTVLVLGTDDVMTRWGRKCGTVGRNGRSIAAWACEPQHVNTVMRWAKGRSDLQRVRRATRVYPKRGDHIHVYVVTDEHPALGGEQ